MAAFFKQITEAFTSLTIKNPDIQNKSDRSKSKGGSFIRYDEYEDPPQPNTPNDLSSNHDYALQAREFDHVPHPHDPMRPNFIQTGMYDRNIGHYYPSGTSAPIYTRGDIRKLETLGTLKRQTTVGRWKAVCDGKKCLEDCAEGYWEKICPIDMQTQRIVTEIRFMGRCNQCGRNFHENIPGI
ncbi:hypothetical protein E4T42_06058 [Aureobasidium subglaciale]|nr:hypothetical protein E4T42_06058 [Aureobasidium subglaciale]